MDIETIYLKRPLELVALFKEALKKDFEGILNGDFQESGRAKRIAEILHIHPNHLSSTVIKVTGKSPCDFINEMYIEKAKSLLSVTTMSIADVGYTLTFEEPTNFTKYFKKHTGFTPKQYRNQLNNNS